MKLDTFVNTKEKRHCVFVIITLCLTLKLIFVYGVLGSRLIALTTYNDVFSLLDTSEITWTYLSRIVLSLMSKADTNLNVVIQAMLSSFRIEGMLTLLCVGLMIHSWKQSRPRLKLFILGGFCISFLLCSVFLYRGFHASTLMDVVDALQVIGLIILLTCVAYGFTCIYGLIQKLFQYRDIYHIEVIEIED